MSDWTKIGSLCALFAFASSASFASTPVAETKIDEYEIKIKSSYDSGLDSSTSKTASTNKVKTTLPIVITANKTKGSSTSSVNLDAALLFDGSYGAIDFAPSTLLTQYQPLKGKPAKLTIDFDDFNIETKDKKWLRGFSFDDFVLVGTVPPGGHIKISADLESEAEGPGFNIDDRKSGFSKTYTTGFTVNFLSLFGTRTIWGKDITHSNLQEVELEGKLTFEVLGTKTAEAKLEIAPSP